MESEVREYILGDMIAHYNIDGEGHVGFLLLPEECPFPKQIEKNMATDSLVQIKIAGDIYGEAYALGNTMRNGETVRRLKLKEQLQHRNKEEIRIQTVLGDTRGNEVSHFLKWKQGASYVEIWCEYRNLGTEEIVLEMFESFSISGLTPYIEKDAPESMVLHRIRSVWSAEGRHEAIPIEDLQLEPAWGPHAVRCEKYGQVGSMPVNKFFPFVAIEDVKNHVFFGAQIAHNASWQMEVYRKDEGLCVSGGLADRDFGQWMKRVGPGENFTTPKAIVSAGATDSVDVFTRRLTNAAFDAFLEAPESERELPVIFNEYCTTWGNPSHENIRKILSAIQGKGFGYFVIDCGWYKEAGVPWDISMGDYQVSKELFPQGLEETVKAIREKNLIPGIWFEIENVGRAARAYHLEEHLLHRDGAVLTSYFRRFWNMTDPWVEEYLTKKVIGTLKKYGFGYMKIDYNETIGAGCDGFESPGEGLRRNMQATREFIEKVKRQVPGIILENCSSGGHRLEPGLMAQMSMASFSDAHECEEIPIIAANLHRVIHPAQSQIWAVIRKSDSLKRIAYSLAATFLGRMCVSGDVTDLSKDQWGVIDRGIAFYREIVPIIKQGQTYQYGQLSKSMRHPKGWQGILRVGDGGMGVAVIHIFDGELPEEISIPVAGTLQKVLEIYSDDVEEDKSRLQIKDGMLCYRPLENKKAVAVLLERV